MKMKLLFAALIVAASTVGAAVTAAAKPPRYNAGPGIAMAGSQYYSSLPADARSFIDRHYKGVTVVKCEKYFAKGKYEVELANGVDIDFNAKGKVLEIDAPDGRVLAASVVKDLIHSKSYKYLEEAGMTGNVEAIDLDNRGRVVEVELSIPEPDVYVFDIDGNFIAISD